VDVDAGEARHGDSIACLHGPYGTGTESLRPKRKAANQGGLSNEYLSELGLYLAHSQIF
jgi:hypothetical protein